ncbi:MAG: RICIN domain-containing protein [Bacteroidales bacterium]|nr:RICIN domain-containing protein [Bacteroidales bacterium]
MTAFQGTAFGQKATFSDCKLKHNVVTDGGKQLQCQYTARFSDMKSHKKIKIVMQIECPKGKVYKYLNNDGKNVSVTASKEYNNQYDRPILENKRLGIYNSRLHPKPGTNTYYVRLVAYELKTGKVIGKSGYMSFTNTGKSSDGGKVSNNNASKSGSKSKGKGKWAKISKGNYHVACAENAMVYVGAKNKVMANGTNIELVGKYLEDDQQWYFLPVDDYYYICSAINRNYVLDVKKGVAAAGTNIQLYQRNNSEAQRWYLERCNTNPGNPKENHEAFIIRSALNPDLVIEFEGKYGDFGSNIRLGRCSRKKSQMWRLE